MTIYIIIKREFDVMENRNPEHHSIVGYIENKHKANEFVDKFNNKGFHIGKDGKEYKRHRSHSISDDKLYPYLEAKKIELIE